MEDPFAPSGRKNHGGFILNCLTVAVILATLAVAGVFAFVFINPETPYNPYQPPTVPPTFGPPTATPTPEIFLPATWTPTAVRTATPEVTATSTPAPTSTPAATSLIPEATATGPPFSLQPGSPVLTPNIANDLECDWMGVGGQAFKLDGEPMIDIGVHLEGEIAGLRIELDTLTGSAPELGPAGYVFNVSDHPIASDETLWVQLNDTAGVPLSEPAYLTTSNSCDENMVLVNWKQVR
ncbi:MAG: hypothetical protein WBR18_02730 [Anaerolineales bacterium]